MLAIHTRLLHRRIRPVVPAPVLAQAWRGGLQASLSRMLAGCRIAEHFADEDARQIGRWLGKRAVSDVVDAHVITIAAREPGSIIYTADVDDLRLLADVAQVDARIVAIP